MTLSPKHYLILTLILLCGFALRSHEALQSANLEHDDQISLLAAAGQLGDYTQFTQDNRHSPIVRPASDWQRFFKPDPSLDFASNAQQISLELQQHDIHPPMYFIWLSVVVAQVDQITPAIGWLSNAGFYLLNGLLLFALALRVLNHPAQALLAVFIWSVSTAAILGSVVARHYELLTFFVLLSTLLLWPNLQRNNLQRNHLHWPSLMGFGVLVMLGFLANYQFLFHLAALSLLILLAHFKHPSIVLAYGLVTLLGLGIALYLYPALLNQTRDAADGMNAISAADIRFRLRNTLEEIARYCAAGTLVLLVIAARKREWLRQIDQRLWLLVAVNLAALAGAYLAFISPRHAMGGRYMASVGPLLSILFAVVLFAFWQHRIYRQGLVALIVLPALLLAYKPGKTHAPPQELDDVPLVVSDFNDRGVWPGIVWQLRPAQKVLVTDLDTLLVNPALRQSLLDPASIAILVSNPTEAPNSPAEQRQFLAELDQQSSVESLPEEDRGLDYFRITPDRHGG